MGQGRANPVTLAALGVLAYIAETMLHEAGGHGLVCLATGGRIALLAPLFMRCSVVTPWMVAAGPAANALAAAASLLALYRMRSDAWRYFFWLSFVFNALVMCGYLLVGAATGFGDWAVLFAGVAPDWAWRLPAGIAALALYGQALKLASRAFVAVTALGRPSIAARARLILIPTGAAALVALAAEFQGGRTAPMALALAFGCTLFVGLTLMGVGDGNAGRKLCESRLRLPLRVPAVILAALLAAGFVLVVGPGVPLTDKQVAIRGRSG
ncbi:MAG TPA: hypothetical protein VG889_09310 [Rhizomicrobium sp.]|nr:hypothetical protein [Rhizomicrobium sp.]